MIKNGLPKVKEKDSEENTKDMPEIEGFDFGNLLLKKRLYSITLFSLHIDF